MKEQIDRRDFLYVAVGSLVAGNYVAREGEASESCQSRQTPRKSWMNEDSGHYMQ